MSKKVTKKQIGIFLLVLALAILLGWHLYHISEKYRHNTEHQLFLERQDHMTSLVEKDVQLANVMYQAAWSHLSSITEVLQKDFSNSNYSIAGATQYLKTYVSLDDCDVIMIDKFGTYYSSDETSGVFNEDITNVLMETEQNAFLYKDEDTDTEYMVFAEKLDEDLMVRDVCVRYLAIAYNTQGYEKIALSDGTQEDHFTYILDQDGKVIFRNGEDTDLYSPNDLLTSLKYVKFTNEGSLDAFEADLSAHRTSAYEVFIHSKDYFIAQAQIPNTNWTLVSYIPTDVLGNNTSKLILYTHWYARALIAFFVVFTILIAGGSLWISRLVRRTRNEKENASRILLMNEKIALANQEADEANAAKSEFLSRMSHDMRTPINGIIGMTAIAKEHMDDSEKLEHCLDGIEQSSEELRNLVEDVLSLNRIETGEIKVTNEKMTLQEICDECCALFEEYIGDKKVRFEKDLQCDMDDEVYTDIEVIKQILANIIDNAVKFSPKNGTVTFRVCEMEREKESVTLRLSVEDKGQGMKKEFLPHLFEAFSREKDINRTNYEGTGLGMAISKGYVDMLGGAIVAESQVGKGTKFHIEIPMKMEPKEFSYDLNKRRNRTIKGMRILLVEDNEVNMEIAQEILEEEGAIVENAANGEEAVKLFTDSDLNYYDAILMDIMMPVMDGYEATAAIRKMKRPDAQTVPIIAMTANAYDEDVRKSVDAGMNSHVAKPIVVNILIKTLLAYRID